jgi:hypothetical protein
MYALFSEIIIVYKTGLIEIQQTMILFLKGNWNLILKKLDIKKPSVEQMVFCNFYLKSSQ